MTYAKQFKNLEPNVFTILHGLILVVCSLMLVFEQFGFSKVTLLASGNCNPVNTPRIVWLNEELLLTDIINLSFENILSQILIS